MLAWWLTLILLAVSADAADELQISDLPESTTLFSTHPAIQYLPESDCIHRTLWWCSGRGYPWGNYDYLDQYTDQYRSFAVVTNEHNHAYGNPHREIVIKVPPARGLRIYGVQRALTWGRELARQEICIGEQGCFPMDVPGAYRNAPNDHEPVLLWEGLISTPFPQLYITLRMTEQTHHKGQQPKWMTLDSVVCYGVYASDPPGHSNSEPPEHSYTQDRFIAGSNPWTIAYEPLRRWTTSSTGFKQATTEFKKNNMVDRPRLSFSFSGSGVKIWSAPRSQLEFSPGGVEVCINAACELVDVHQLYLNPSRPLPSWSLDAQQANASTTDESHSDMVNVTNTSPENEPILLWSCTDLDFRRRHDVVVTLVERNPALGSNRGDFRKAITLSHVSYTVVVTEWEIFRILRLLHLELWPLYALYACVGILGIAFSLFCLCGVIALLLGILRAVQPRRRPQVLLQSEETSYLYYSSERTVQYSTTTSPLRPNYPQGPPRSYNTMNSPPPSYYASTSGPPPPPPPGTPPHSGRTNPPRNPGRSKRSQRPPPPY